LGNSLSTDVKMSNGFAPLELQAKGGQLIAHRCENVEWFTPLEFEA